MTFKIPFSLSVDKQCRGAIAKPFWQVLNCPNRIGRDEKTNLHFSEDAWVTEIEEYFPPEVYELSQETDQNRDHLHI